MAIESPRLDTPESSLKRKKSKKNLTPDTSAQADLAGVDEDMREKKRRKKEGKGERKNRRGEKKKKRKRDKQLDDEASAATSSSKKEKKKKHKSEAAPSSPPLAAAPSLLTPAEIDSYFAEHSITITVPAGGAPVIPVLSFDALPIPEALRSAFTSFSKPTPVQACTWPPMLDGRDVVGIAETGSGKTLAFGIPALARLLSSPAPPATKSKKFKKPAPPRVLILAPTRELALQTHDALKSLGARCVAIFGGVPKEGQLKELKEGAQIVVGTPGRIKDLVGDGALDLGSVECLVLDEADRMLDKGFENDIRTIVGWTKAEERQTLMFSATWPDAVRRLAASFQCDPVRVTIGSDDLTANSRVEQVVEVFDDDREKDSRLLKHLQTLLPQKRATTSQRILIFALYKKEAARLEDTLRAKGFTITGLHGDMAQQKRLDALQSFRDGTTRLLVATDVAARGLDIPDVAVVVNYTFPLTIEDYIHRIGRTGRGGKSGKSITFFTGDKHERALAGELAGVLREGGFANEAQKLNKFPMSVKKKTHSAYGAFFRDDLDMSAAPTRITFD
ncbi:P-loop containing nucleoside triphosphate hydrolase protein [Vararia minispora EC-137]|uniref:P-loop containing nucleoside triphosphate hydrolase protein n=1 Tax=Vararia minispora EC-137 TaxID=1314806 RepID=A0ACB8QBE8_9AGAM|nr:P-loop containing nucleoside triphosphate hydrolase protein [Vararia minispora EC-137]